MEIDKNELSTILAQFNPWWMNNEMSDIPLWHRAAFTELFKWAANPPALRATLLTGARQIGKTTLLRQVIAALIKKGVPPADILYATFDHPIIKLAGVDEVISVWREREHRVSGIEYIFLDEAQFIKDWGTWVKHQVDFQKDRRIIFTGSAMPTVTKQESGVGRWHSIRLTTLSFYEYFKFKSSLAAENFSALRSLFAKNTDAKNFPKSTEHPDINTLDTTLAFDPQKFDLQKLLLHPDFLQNLKPIKSLRELFNWSEQDFIRVAEECATYLGYFHDYLMRGGFPQTIQIENVNQAQRLLREDIVDKVLKRDMTAIFGVRKVLDLERVFLYLCMHEGGLLALKTLCSCLEVNRQTAENFIELLENAHLIYKLLPFGYGKEVLRGQYKVYLADSALASAVLLRGKSLLDNPEVLGFAVEAAIYKHLLIFGFSHGIRFSYWQNKKQKEVDIIAEVGEQIVPFEIKYQSQNVCASDIKGLLDLCAEKSIKYAYVITKSLSDFGPLKISSTNNTLIMKIPAAFFCYWLGLVELTQSDLLQNQECK
ncbi:MAG: AAA family ATPase [Gammaproteobacteria bacterium]|nr:AAA family ATPase [Gammaproteobacteria bacterium]